MRIRVEKLIPGEQMWEQGYLYRVTRIERSPGGNWWITGSSPDAGVMLFVRLDGESVQVER